MVLNRDSVGALCVLKKFGGPHNFRIFFLFKQKILIRGAVKLFFAKELCCRQKKVEKHCHKCLCVCLLVCMCVCVFVCECVRERERMYGCMSKRSAHFLRTDRDSLGYL